MPKGFKYIRSLKDVMDVNFKPNPRYNPKHEIDARRLNITDWATEAPFICPITNFEVGVNHKFSMLRTCGCAFSERALKECPSERCLVCNTPFTSADIFPLNPLLDDDEIQDLKAALKEKLEAERKQKREKAKGEQGAKEGQDGKDGKEKKRKKEQKDGGDPKKAKKLSGAVDLSLTNNNKPNEKKPRNVPANATATVYASLFTSSVNEPQVKESFLCRNVSRG